MNRTLEYIETFPRFRDEYVISTPPGSKVTHIMPFPGHYPGDLPLLQELRDAGKTAEDLIPPHYLVFAEDLRNRHIQLGRLVVAHGPESGKFDIGHVQDLYDLCKPLPHVGEVARFAWYEDQVDKMRDACGPISTPASNYLRGVQQETPKESLWMVHSPSEEGLALTALWRASYRKLHNSEKVFIGGIAMTAPFQPNEEILKYASFWYDLYHSDESFPVEDIPKYTTVNP